MNIVAALLIFTVIVVIHEFGHFLLAKKNGIEVTEFSVGMGPRLITLCKTNNGMVCKLFCSQKLFEEREDWQHITKYSWKLFPIGGSCAMVGEDMEDDSENSFNSKGVWARFSVIFAGPFFNFVLAFVFSIIILGNAGIDMPEVVQVSAGQPGAAAGIKEGDMVKSIDGHKISIGREITTYLQLHPLSGDTVAVKVERDGKEQTINIDPDYKTYLFGFGYSSDEKVKPTVSDVTDKGAFQKAGIKANDVILSVNDQAINGNLSAYVDAWQTGDAPLRVTVQRGGEQVELQVTPFDSEAEGRKLIGVNILLTRQGETVWRRAPFGTTLSHTWDVCVSAGGAMLDALGRLITRGEGVDQMSGPVGVITQIAEQTREYKLMGYLNVLIMISINLGLVNLLPIPGLDGCRILFVLFEMIFRRPVNRKVEAYIHLAGYLLLLGVMVYFTFHDVINIFA